MTQEFNSKWLRTQKDANYVNSICKQAQLKRMAYIDLLQQSIKISSQNLNNETQTQYTSFLSTHPQNQSRVATIVALTDYFSNRRDLDSLVKFKQTYHVMSALNNVNSVLLESAESSIENSDITNTDKTLSNEPNLTSQLDDLKKTYEKGLITNSEYEKKRLEILNFK